MNDSGSHLIINPILIVNAQIKYKQIAQFGKHKKTEVSYFPITGMGFDFVSMAQRWWLQQVSYPTTKMDIALHMTPMKGPSWLNSSSVRMGHVNRTQISSWSHPFKIQF